MLVLKILGAIVLLGAAVYGLFRFDRSSVERFGYRFLTRASFIVAALAMYLVIGGHAWFREAQGPAGDPLNGIVLMILGAVLAIGLVVLNFRRTNLAYGLGGSAIQLTTFGILTAMGPFIFAIGLVFSVVMAAGAKPVWVVNK